MVQLTETLKAANAKIAIDSGYMKEVLLTNFSINDKNLKEQNKKMRNLLKQIEFSGYDYSTGMHCLFCNSYERWKIDYKDTYGHKPTCPLIDILYGDK